MEFYVIDRKKLKQENFIINEYEIQSLYCSYCQH